MKMYGWVITKDHIEGGTVYSAVSSDPGYDLIVSTGSRFKLYDDDGELYYEGSFSMHKDSTGFEPLDWARWKAGCTEIKYLEEGRWVSL